VIGYYLWRWGLFRKLYLHKDGGGKWTSKFNDAYIFNDIRTANMAASIVWEKCRVVRVLGMFTLGDGE
jgi:hypothetical protein